MSTLNHLQKAIVTPRAWRRRQDLYNFAAVFQGPPTAHDNLHIIANKHTIHRLLSFPSLYPMGGLSGNDGLVLPCQRQSRAADCFTADESRCRRVALESAWAKKKKSTKKQDLPLSLNKNTVSVTDKTCVGGAWYKLDAEHGRFLERLVYLQSFLLKTNNVESGYDKALSSLNWKEQVLLIPLFY